MKLNNKGFAISGILYPIFVLFLILLFGTISNLATAKAVIDRNKTDIEKQLNGDNVNPYFVMDGHDITIANGYTYDPTTGVKAYNSEGKLLGTEQITIISSPTFNNNKDGVYTVSYSVTDARGRTTTDTKKITVVTQAPTFFNYTGAVQTYTTPKKGVYRIELWGANGGPSGAPGRGAYVKGDINLPAALPLYFVVGETLGVSGGQAGSRITYNGGGKGGGNNSTPGGGATDVRLSNGAWNDVLGLRSRIMVAGGGAGHGSGNGSTAGGAGGGLIGYTGTAGIKPPGTGGTQNIGGTPGRDGAIGTFGVGGAGGNGGYYLADYFYPWPGGGGGGGYYGGAGGGGDDCCGYGGGGGGGSSFISGHNGSNAIDSLGAPTGQADHYSGYVFTDTIMIDGAGYAWSNVKGALQLMPKPTGDYYSSGSGHLGHGYAEITPLLLINVE